jgi:hypothetical protein
MNDLRYQSTVCMFFIRVCSAFSEDESFIEIDLVNKLQSIVEKQRDQIRTLDTSLADIKSELDEVKALL